MFCYDTFILHHTSCNKSSHLFVYPSLDFLQCNNVRYKLLPPPTKVDGCYVFTPVCLFVRLLLMKSKDFVSILMTSVLCLFVILPNAECFARSVFRQKCLCIYIFIYLYIYIFVYLYSCFFVTIFSNFNSLCRSQFQRNRSQT